MLARVSKGTLYRSVNAAFSWFALWRGNSNIFQCTAPCLHFSCLCLVHQDVVRLSQFVQLLTLHLCSTWRSASSTAVALSCMHISRATTDLKSTTRMGASPRPMHRHTTMINGRSLKGRCPDKTTLEAESRFVAEVKSG